MAGRACPARRQAGISPCCGGGLGPSVLTEPAVPIQNKALLHTLPPWEPLAPLETWAPLQGWWANLHRLAALQSWWPLTMQDHSQGRGRHRQHPCLMQKMRVLHLPHCGTGPLQPPSPPRQCSQPLVLPDPNSHPTTSCSTPNSCHPIPPASICGGSSSAQPWPPLLGDPSDTMAITILTPWHPQTIMALLWGPSLHRSPLTWDHLGPLTMTILCSGEPAPLWSRGPPGPLSSLFLFLDTPRPFGLHGPTSQDSLGPLAIMALFQLSLLHRSPLVLGSSPGTLIITIPCSRGPPDPLGSPRLPLSPAPGTP